MEIYKDLDNDSGVARYELGVDYITVWFKKGARSYTYNYASAGAFHVEEMKKLAQVGEGLNAYIMHNVKDRYVK